ncbi:MAG TPA: proline iminopeptidase-family hydrolase [Gaiellaceae bacterium]
MSARAVEGRIPFRGHETWYRVVGGEDAPGKLPVVCLHGGPGATHWYLEPLEGIAAGGRRAVFYDQLGCGASSQPHDPSLWTVELFVDEVYAVCEALGLERLHLFGNSWGGMLAMEVALTKPDWLASLVLASSPASIPQWVEETGKLRALLPGDVQATLTRHEEAGTTDSPEYEEACLVFYRRHVCRVDPFPDCVARAFAELSREVYETMNGPSEFHVTGTLREWSVVPRLGEIDVPALVVSGEHDEATPAISRTVHEGIRGSELVLLDGCSHMAHVEQPERYLALLDGFFSRVEQR